jgi:putative two-component system response regulator
LVSLIDSVSHPRARTRQVIYDLAGSIRERDRVTYDHCRRVAIYAQRFARYRGWTRTAARELALAGLVHDLGKTWVRNEVLLKPAALSQSEREMIEKHPVTAAQLLWAFDMPESILDAVLSHHERWDGRGYPEGRAGDAIPLGARMLSVADVFDVITTPRPYKSAMSVEAARERIMDAAGSAFDPEVAESFTHLLDARSEFLLWAPPQEFDVAADDPWAAHDSAE